MITITAHGRLAFQPELKLLPGGGSVCEFRLLSSRFAKGAEHTEAVTFFVYGAEAEEFCSSTVKGQEISATGSQETQEYTKDGVTKTYVKYRLTWFSRGRKPYQGDRVGSGQDSQGQGGYRGGSNASRPPPNQRPDDSGSQPQYRQTTGHPPRDFQNSGYGDVGNRDRGQDGRSGYRESSNAQRPPQHPNPNGNIQRQDRSPPVGEFENEFSESGFHHGPGNPEFF